MQYWERFLAHRHWITLRIFSREIHVCARCSGIVIGFMALKNLLKIATGLLPSFIPLNLGFSISLFLALPSIIDWTSQNLGFRQSNNRLRFLTGFFEGVGVWVLSITGNSILLRTGILATVMLGVISITYLINRVHKSK